MTTMRKLSTKSGKLATSMLILLVLIASLAAFTIGINPSSGNSPGKNSGNSFSPHFSQGSKTVGAAVNPNNLYTSEPAPMGLADYGIGPKNMPYIYNTTSFLGIIKIGSLSVIDNTTNSSSLTFQLNVNLEFNNSGNTYVYWVQDVAFLNTTTGSVQFINNIWNMSSNSAEMLNSTVSGNGTVASAIGTQFYYNVSNPNLPGASVIIKDPSTVKLKVNSLINSNGLPEIVFEYQDGFGWVTYDNVNFTFATSVSSYPGFVVDGFQYNPFGTYYDAELIMGGPGEGSTTTDLQSNMSLQLQYWNGNNYQEISNAYNFGSNTAETIGNADSGAYYFGSNGTLLEKITNGTGSLSQVYNSSMVSSLGIKAPISGGTISLNGFNTTFTGDKANLTLFPGSYSVNVYTKGVLYYSTSVNLAPGQDKVLAVNEYLVTFNETGLPSGSQWRVNLSYSSYTSNSDNVEFYLSNGTYHFNISSSNPDYFSNISTGSFTVSGTEVTLHAGFSPVLYNVTFRENSLPIGTKWYVMFHNTTFSSSNGTITVHIPKGTYDFILANLSDYYTLNNSYNLTVGSNNLTTLVLFHQYDQIIGFVAPQGATVTINGKTVATENGKFSFLAPAGNYTINVDLPGYYTYTKNLSLNYGQNATLSINLTRIPSSGPNIQGYETLGGLVAILAIAGIGAIIVKRR